MLSFVTLTNGSQATTVTYDAGVALGPYQLVLESYNTAISSRPLVKTDTLLVTVYKYARTVAIKTTHESRSDYSDTLTIENIVFTPTVGSGKVNMRLA